jgi:D-alanine-D-alanine ligase
VDFFLPEDGEPVIIEINTLPGFTPISMFPRLWGLAGIEYGALITKIVELGMARHARDQQKQDGAARGAKVGG